MLAVVGIDDEVLGGYAGTATDESDVPDHCHFPRTYTITF